MNARPGGNVPVTPMLGVGEPVAVTVKLPAAVVAKVALFALEIPSACPTVSEKLCVELPAEFVAVKVTGNMPGETAVPESVAVPLRLSVKLTPAGNVPENVNAGTGKPVVVTVKDPADAA